MGSRTTILGLGAMGSAITARLRDTGHDTTVWNRTAAKTAPHAAAGSKTAATISEAIHDADTVLVVLLDHASVQEQLTPHAAELTGKTVVNLVTTTPNQARETAAWAADNGIAYVDGAVMAVPSMIGEHHARLLYSGDEHAYDTVRPILETLGTAEYAGEDPGLASLKDMALLAAMDLMLLGYVQAIAMMRTTGTPAADTAAEVEAWLAAMLPQGRELAAIVDGGTYDTGGQSVDFDRFGIQSLITASREQGVSAQLLEPHRKLLEELAATGRGDSDWIRIIERLTIQ
ncbi:NAD(P)-dependent oxidoreductase [Glycomyces algeriensis]|uniref:Oxidoreductase n=1 Tax=Glycomyces algeriensis TaxID=256037 RepID=A0A9W6GB35_9ACTN|nr:NAD(P)-binding domain-containing protein [Glycomyces algeriensis]MDA1365393.1 NAD(P)-binding domain-containing protein [Glycomyces algeriensis]MDR7351078.1 3-hydroxyisobutyrate dehydrogenase-like beta-hydroxyacid dehydrogenase [Glycomyces algeriensis]GLI43791.1 oxidoreductase [Glycomyces algeriensis]